MRLLHVFAVLIVATLTASAQSVSVPKTNPMKVYMHYMPWFDAPPFSATWGWHWTMNNKVPANFDASGKRIIASHFYPLIGPYATMDPDVIEYHLLLMKLSGIDGVLIDWYGTQGSNADVQSLLTNSNAVIDMTDDVGLDFGLILEDRFWNVITHAKGSLKYAGENYFTRENYIRHGADNDPLVGVFGPIVYQTEADWTEILSQAGEPVEFLQLWYESQDAGSNSDGEYLWIYEEENNDDYLTRLQAYYQSRASSQKTVMAVAYPGFEDFYQEGGAGQGYFTIPHGEGEILDQTLDLVDQHQSKIDFVQLATWNDFGEGTMFEPTLEFGFRELVKIQQWTGVPYTEDDLASVYKLFVLRKLFTGKADKQTQLDAVAEHFVNLEISEAKALLAQIETTPPANLSAVVLPKQIEAENFHGMSGAAVIMAIDKGAGLAVDSLNEGDSVFYQLQVDLASDFNVKVRAKSIEGAEIEIINEAGEVLQSVLVAAGDNYQTVETTITLDAGDQALTFKGKTGTTALNFFVFSVPNGTENSLGNAVEFWPTIADHTVSIKNDGKFQSLQVVDLMGRLHLTKNNISRDEIINVDVSHLHAGLHIIKLNGTKRSDLKFIKK